MNWNSLAGARKRMESWMRESDVQDWPPYPVVANESGEMARLYFGAEPPDGWTIIGRNCAHTAALKRIGDPKSATIVIGNMLVTP